MCAGGGGNNRHHEEEAKRRQWAAERAAQEQQARMEALAREREAVAAQQQAQMQQMAAQQQAAEIAQQQQTAEMRVQQQERLAGINARGQAVTQSLRILSQQSAQAPTAQATGRAAGVTGAKQTTAGLRIGSTGRGTGSGANVAV
jgi:hypothetical protein